jgi:hypothetical protein
MHPRHRFLLSIVIFTVCCGILAIAIKTMNASMLSSIQQHCGYWWILGTGTLWVGYLLRCTKPLLRPSLLTSRQARGHWAPICLLTLASVYLHTQGTHGLRVMYDEYTFATQSMLMHENRQSGLPMIAHYIDGEYHYMHVIQDKRTLFFPFLVSILHDLTGYRVSNALFLNAILTPVMLFLLYGILYFLFGKWPALVASLSFAGLPVLGMSATGGGYELLNLCMLLAFVGSGAYFLAGTNHGDRLCFWTLTTVLLAQVRTESAFFLGFLPVGYVIHSLKLKQWSFPSWLAFSPILLLTPVFTALRIMSSNPEYTDGKGAEGFLSMGYFQENIGHALLFLIGSGDKLGASPWISVIGGVFFILIFVRWTLQLPSFIRKNDPILALIMAASGVVVTTLVIQCHHWGQLDDAMAARFSLPFLLFLCISIAAVLSNCQHLKLQWKNGITALCIAHLLFTGGSFYGSGRAYPKYHIAREIQWSLDFLSKHRAEDCLVISFSSTPFISEKYASIPLFSAVMHSHQIAFLIRNRVYRHIYIIQRFYEPGLYEGGPVLDHGWPKNHPFEFELVADQTFVSGLRSKIYEITGYDKTRINPVDLEDASFPTRIDYRNEIMKQMH